MTRLLIPAALVAALAATALSACVATDPLSQEIAGLTALDANGRAALSGTAQALADELVMEAAGMPDEPFPLASAPALGGGPGFSIGEDIGSISEGLAHSTISRFLVEKLGDARTTDDPITGASEPDSNPSFQFSVSDGHLVGETSQRISKSIDGHTADAEVRTSFDVTACPAADGSVTAKISFHTKASASRTAGGMSGQEWGALDFTMTAAGMVGDDANLAQVDLATAAEITSGLSATTDEGSARSGINFASSWEYRLTYDKGNPGSLDPRGLPTITRASQAVGLAQKASLLKATVGATYSIATDIFLIAQEHWRSGACVRMGIAADANLPTVEKSSSTGLTVTPVSKLDGQPTGGTMTATREEGAGTIDPTDAQPSPTQYTYRAPSTDDTTLVLFTSTSKRGVGLLTQKFQTTIPGWVIHETINGIETYALKCGSLSGEWLISSAGSGWYQAQSWAQVDATTGTGTYGISGTAEGYPFRGGGIIELETLPDGSMVMHILPGETGYVGNGDFPITEDDEICNIQ